MEQKLTNEEAIGIFAIYHKAQVQFGDTIGAIDFDDNEIRVVINAGYEERPVPVGNLKLLLKPFPSISDEDAIGVAKMLGREIELDKTIYPDNPFLKGRYEVSDHQKLVNIGKREIRACGNKLPYEVADFLRSKGYELPYKGQSLFDLGIAIDATKTDKS